MAESKGEYLLGFGTTVVAIRDSSGGYQCALYIPGDGVTDYNRSRISGRERYAVIDELFKSGNIKSFEDKIKVALTRLCTTDGGDGAPPAEMAELYGAYIKRNAKKASKLFEEKHDVVCGSMLSFLGYDLDGLRAQREKDSRKPKRQSAAQLGNVAIKAMKKGDTAEKRRNRERSYLADVFGRESLSIPGRRGFTPSRPEGYVYFMSLSAKGERLISKLAEEDLLTKDNISGLIGAALVDGNDCFNDWKVRPKLAKKLYEAADGSYGKIDLHFQGGSQNRWHDARSFDDLLYVGCSLDSVKAVCQVMPERVNAMWKPGFANHPDIALAMLPHLDPDAFANAEAVLCSFANSGLTEGARKMKELGFDLPGKTLSKAAQIAAQEGHTETAATLLSMMGD